jgi:hypothetical protein
MEKKFLNYINVVEFGESKNIKYLFLENKDDLLKIDQFMNSKDYTEALLLISKLNESIIIEYALEYLTLNSLDTRRGHQSTLTYIMMYLSKNNKKTELSVEIEIKSRFIALIRNPIAHDKNHEIDFPEIYLCYKYFHEILDWYLEKRGWISEPLPSFLSPENSKQLIIDSELPDLIFDKSHNDILPNNHEMKHDQVIVDYLIKQHSLDRITNTYFPKENANTVYAILSGVYGIDRRWKKYFKTAIDKGELISTFNKLDDKKHKIIKRALKSVIF